MFLVRCIPIVGTAINAVEAGMALAEGDGRKCASKLAQAGVGVVMDAAFVMSGGMSSLVTAPLKGGAIEGGKIAGKKVLEKLLVQEAGNLAANVATRKVTEYVADKACSSNASANGNDPPDEKSKLPKEHEVDDGSYDSAITINESPITFIKLGSNGRVEILEAEVKKHHLRPVGQVRHNITARVRRFVESLGRVVGEIGFRESDEVGHIIGDLLGGPNHRTYNFFPQSPNCNMEYYHKVEKPIYEYLSEQNGNDLVKIRIDMVYVNYLAGVSPNRPRMIKVKLTWPDGKIDTFDLSNL